MIKLNKLGISVIFVAFGSIALNCHAIDLQTASGCAARAKSLARQGHYDEAFTEVGWLLRDKSPTIQKYAEDVLLAYPDVANAGLSRYDQTRAIEMACEDGTPTTIHTTTELIDSLGRFAEGKKVAETRARIESLDNNPEVIACNQAQQEKKSAEEKERQKEEARLKSAAEALISQTPAMLRALDIFGFCAEYGEVLRGDRPKHYAAVQNIIQLFRTEAARRHIRIENELVLKERIRIGIDQCTLYASWGYPERSNRSVGPWGVHSQMIYGSNGPYVYVQNGTVRSFQD